MIRALLDSDVILDHVLHRKLHYKDAEILFETLADLEFVGHVSAIALLNVHYFASKEVDRPFAKEKVVNLLSLLSVSTIDESCFQTALALNFNDYEDAVQCASAMSAGLDAIVTRNAKDYETSPIPVYSPAEFLELLNSENE